MFESTVEIKSEQRRFKILLLWLRFRVPGFDFSVYAVSEKPSLARLSAVILSFKYRREFGTCSFRSIAFKLVQFRPLSAKYLQ